jgi:hypothetical protein
LQVFAKLVKDLGSMICSCYRCVIGSYTHEKGVIEVPIVVCVRGWMELQLLDIVLSNVFHEGLLEIFPNLVVLVPGWQAHGILPGEEVLDFIHSV